MNLNKKILFSTVIIVIFMIAIIIGAFFYWPEEQIPSDTSQETEKTKCLENVAKMTDEELMNQIKDLEYVKKAASTSEEIHKFNLIIEQSTKYLNCKVMCADEQLYNATKEFINGLLIEDRHKERLLKKILYDQEDNDIDRNKRQNFSFLIISESLDNICSAEFVQECNDSLSSISTSGNPWLGSSDKDKPWIEHCDRLCEIIEKSTNDQSYFKDVVLNMELESKYPEEKVLIPKELSNLKRWAGRWRVSVAYRIGSQEFALQICNDFKKEEEQGCRDLVNLMSNFWEEYKGCQKYKENLISLICKSH